MNYASSLHPDLTLGVPEVDREHGLQVTLLDALAAALLRDPADARIPEALQKLVDVTEGHFAGEELLMRRDSYPRYHLHVEEHRHLLEQLGALQARLQQPEAAGLLIGDLRRWLEGHIRGMDRDYATFASSPESAGPHALQ